jgi:hypothetical protein
MRKKIRGYWLGSTPIGTLSEGGRGVVRDPDFAIS